MILPPNSSDSIVKAAAAFSCAIVGIGFVAGVCYGNVDGWRLVAMAAVCVFSIGGALSVLDNKRTDGKSQ
jgi:hypothetical protein